MKRSATLVRKTPLRRTMSARDAKPRRRVRRGLRRPRMPQQVREAVWRRAHGRCDCCGVPLDREAWDVHHRQLRSRGGDDSLANLLALDHDHHMGWHRQPAEATTRGLIVHSWADPTTTPVQRCTGSWYLPAHTEWVRVPDPTGDPS